MNFRRRDKSIVDLLFILALMAVFMLCSIFIVLFGAKVYKKVVHDSDLNYSGRTIQAYIVEKIRRYDRTDGVEVISKDGKSILKLNEELNGTVYCTYLYEDQGFIKEITSPNDYLPDLRTGQKIIEVKDFYVDKISSSIIKFNIRDAYDKDYNFYVTVYSGTH
ncbi:MAG: DUF4860 domain-containing protein [Lachnospiraceae bacterium]|nr:DUF4860 domain-containing protein [Lachnospiraceae bacterium]